jgi:hypothetical protein
MLTEQLADKTAKALLDSWIADPPAIVSLSSIPLDNAPPRAASLPLYDTAGNKVSSHGFWVPVMLLVKSHVKSPTVTFQCHAGLG